MSEHRYVLTNLFPSFYHRSTKSKKSKDILIKDYDEVRRVHSIIWKTILDHYINNEAGVFLKNLGYLCHIMSPEIKFIKHRQRKRHRQLMDGRVYRHECLDFFPKFKYCHTFISPALSKKIDKDIKDGKKYKFLYNEVLSHKACTKKIRLRRLTKYRWRHTVYL